MIWVLYFFAMYLMSAGIRISALWNDKSKKWIHGRKNWVHKVKSLPSKSNPRIWFHVSSLGEFEQARPVMESLKRAQPGLEIILTFFSPSGFSIKSNYPLATVFYLPEDLPGHAKKWIEWVQPDFAVFVKYDLWAGYLNALHQKSIPTILISAHWHPGATFHSSALPPTRSLLKGFNQIFLQKPDHLDYFKNKGFNNLTVAGDTRIDRSLELADEVDQRLPKSLKGLPVVDVVAGSTWPADEKILMEVAEKLNLQMIIAPHDVSEANITRLIDSLPLSLSAIRLSAIKEPTVSERIIVVDSIGVLNILYPLGRVAYIGGGFGPGIHNTLEPIAHHKPVLFGPKYQKFPEAVDLIALNAAWSVANAQELTERLKQLLPTGRFEQAGEIAYNYLTAQSGASKKITQYILATLGANN